MKKLLLLVVCLNSFCTVFSQATFEKFYDIKGSFVMNGLFLPNYLSKTSDKGFVITGTCDNGMFGSKDIYLFKTDSLGDSLWTKTYGGINEDYGYSTCQTNDGGYIIAGTTGNFGAGLTDIYLIKTDSVGNTIWTKTYGGANNDYGSSVTKTNDGGYIVLGGTADIGTGISGLHIIKINAYGDTLWTKIIAGLNASNCGQSVIQTSDLGYVITATGFSNLNLVKLNSSGSTLWMKSFHKKMDLGNAVLQCTDGGYIIAGCTNGFWAGIGGNYDYYVIKTDANGDSLWTRNYRKFDYTNLYSYPYQEAFSIIQTFDGGYFITGTSGTHNWSGSFYLVKINAMGDTTWTRTYGGHDIYHASSGVQTSDGGYVISGNTTYGNHKLVLIKTDPNGISSGTVGIDYKLSSLYNVNLSPNPFSHSTRISLAQTYSDIALEVYNIQGQRVTENHYAACNEITLQRNGLRQGMYFLKLTLDGKKVETRKIIISE